MQNGGSTRSRPRHRREFQNQSTRRARFERWCWCSWSSSTLRDYLQESVIVNDFIYVVFQIPTDMLSTLEWSMCNVVSAIATIVYRDMRVILFDDKRAIWAWTSSAMHSQAFAKVIPKFAWTFALIFIRLFLNLCQWSFSSTCFRVFSEGLLQNFCVSC